jgi:hypothetical protein
MVPLAEPKVEMATERGMTQAKTPSMRLPKVTATASEITISDGDMICKERLSYKR